MAENFEEYEELKYMLKTMDAYEPDMTLNEMRELLHTLLASLNAAEDTTWDSLPNNHSQMLSSTLLDAPTQLQNNFRRNQPTLSPLSSPEVDHIYQLIVVEAEVHHEQDWSPKKAAAENRKRVCNMETTSDDSSVAGPSAPKRALFSNTFRNPGDSGCSSGRDSENDQSIINCDS